MHISMWQSWNDYVEIYKLRLPRVVWEIRSLCNVLVSAIPCSIMVDLKTIYLCYDGQVYIRSGRSQNRYETGS